jgi:hypothetical protein
MKTRFKVLGGRNIMSQEVEPNLRPNPAHIFITHNIKYYSQIIKVVHDMTDLTVRQTV